MPSLVQRGNMFGGAWPFYRGAMKMPITIFKPSFPGSLVCTSVALVHHSQAETTVSATCDLPCGEKGRLSFPLSIMHLTHQHATVSQT